MPSKREEFQQDVRFDILRVLESNPLMSQREVSRRPGISMRGQRIPRGQGLDQLAGICAGATVLKGSVFE